MLQSSYNLSPKPAKPKYTDFSGYGWIIVICGFMLYLIVDGVAYNLGLINSAWLTEFKQSETATSWIGSIFYSVPLLSAPITAQLVENFGCKLVTIVCGIIATVGFIASSFCTSIEQLYLAIGIVAGFGVSAAYIVGILSAERWFDKNRTLAIGIVSAGTGFGTFIIAPITQHLLDAFGWRNTMFFLASLNVLMSVVGCFINDPQWVIDEMEKKSAKEGIENFGFFVENEKVFGTFGRSLSFRSSDIRDNELNVIKLSVNEKSENLSQCEIKRDNKEFESKKFGKESQKLEENSCNKSGNKIDDDQSNIERGKCRFENHKILNQNTSNSSENEQIHDISEESHRKSNKNSENNQDSQNTQENFLEDHKNSPKSLSNHSQILEISSKTSQNLERSSENLQMNQKFQQISLHHSQQLSKPIISPINRPKNRCLSFLIPQFLKEKLKLIKKIFSHFSNRNFSLLAISTFLIYALYNIPMYFMVELLKDHGYTESECANYLSMIGISLLFGMVTLGYIGDVSGVQVKNVNAVCVLICGIAEILLPMYADNSIAFAICCSIFGYSFASAYVLIPKLAEMIVGVEDFATAIGLNFFVQGLALLIGIPFASSIYEAFGSWKIAYQICGSIIASGSIFAFLTKVKHQNSDLS